MWFYNHVRVHQNLAGLTPMEAWHGCTVAAQGIGRIERRSPRPKGRNNANPDQTPSVNVKTPPGEVRSAKMDARTGQRPE